VGGIEQGEVCVAKQTEINDRKRCAVLVHDEARCGDSEQQEIRYCAGHGLQMAKTKQERSDCQHEQTGSPQIDRLARTRRSARRQSPREKEGSEGQGGAKPEHRWPIKPLQEQAADDGACCRARAEHHRIDAKNAGALLFRIKCRGERRATGEYQRGADALCDTGEQ
jgi:hypothetical protein